MNRLTHCYTDIHTYPHSHIHHSQTSLSIHALKYAHKITQIHRHIYIHTHPWTHSAFHTNMVIFAQSHDHVHKFIHTGTQIYVLRCLHSHIHLYMHINMKIRDMLTWTLTQKHAHIHRETYTLKHKRLCQHSNVVILTPTHMYKFIHSCL